MGKDEDDQIDELGEVLNGRKSHVVLCGDAIDILQTRPDECVQVTVTSPPY